jgi:transcriptional regulator with XRE-family HTH domain
MATKFNMKVEFPKKLKAVREKAGYSILALARRAKISRQHIRDLELGNKYITLKTLCKIANALKVPMWKLLYFGNRECEWK